MIIIVQIHLDLTVAVAGQDTGCCQMERLVKVSSKMLYMCMQYYVDYMSGNVLTPCPSRITC